MINEDTKLSELFDIKTHEPYHVGVYRMVDRHGVQSAFSEWAYWNGEFWCMACYTVETADMHGKNAVRSRSCYNGQYTHFCGLAEKPA